MMIVKLLDKKEKREQLLLHSNGAAFCLNILWMVIFLHKNKFLFISAHTKVAFLFPFLQKKKKRFVFLFFAGKSRGVRTVEILK